MSTNQPTTLPFVVRKEQHFKNRYSNVHWNSDIFSICFGKISAQPHTSVKQICFPNGNVLFLSLFSLSKNWMHNVGWGCAEILPLFLWVIWLFLLGDKTKNFRQPDSGFQVTWLRARWLLGNMSGYRHVISQLFHWNVYIIHLR